MDKIIKAINLDYNNKSKSSSSKTLLQFYILLSAPFLSTLFSNQMQDFLKNSRSAKHVLGFITLLMLIIDSAGVTNVNRALIYALIGYSWFVLTTKLDLTWSLLILGLLTIGFLYDTTMKDKEVHSDEDESLQVEDKLRIAKKHYNMRSLIFASIFLVTLIGTYQYVTKKQVQYGGDFDYGKFVFNAKN